VSLQAKLDAFKADFETGKPPYSVPRSVIETMQRATAELIASGAAQRAKKAGDVAPSFSLKDPEGNVVSSDALLRKGPLVVSFYRGVWCPYCNMELQALDAAKPVSTGTAPRCSRSRRRLRRTAANRCARTSSPFRFCRMRRARSAPPSVCASNCPTI
jgi:hypothetical protein